MGAVRAAALLWAAAGAGVAGPLGQISAGAPAEGRRKSPRRSRSSFRGRPPLAGRASTFVRRFR